MKAKKKVIISILTFFVILFVLASSLYIYMYVIPYPIDLNKLNKIENNVVLLDNKNNKFTSKADKYVKYSDIPQQLIDAFVSIEDKRFYNHNGIDLIRVAGAMKNNLFHGTNQGGSTITQQLIKNIYLTPDQSFDRKIKEMRLAINLEKQYSKEEIIEKYLNILYFGSGEYGIKNAALRFFDKNLSDLSLKECALLAGIVKSPTKYNPINNLDNSLSRANLVLYTMYAQNKIDYNSYILAKNDLPIIKNALIYNNFDHKYSENVYLEAATLLDVNLDELPYMNLKIYTYMDKTEQELMYNTISNDSFYTANSYNNLGNALGISVDNDTCGIKSFYSNFNVNLYEFRRSPGSTIKPFAIYGPALEEYNYHLFTKINNNKTNFNDYSPSNYLDHYSDFETLSSSISNSYNIPAVSVLNDIGVDTAKRYLSMVNIKTDNKDGLSLALGGMTNGTSMLDILNMYTTIANNGEYSGAHFIREIRDENGKILYKYNNSDSIKIFSTENANLLTMSLMECAKTGTAKKLSTLDFNIASKTGTVSCQNKNYNSDIYNVSYTTKDTFLFWQGGLKENEMLPSTQSGGGATSAMAKYYASLVYKNHFPTDFSFSQNVDNIWLDKISYEKSNEYVLADNFCPNIYKIKVIINKKNMLKTTDNSFSNIENVKVNEYSDGTSTTLKLELNPRLNYKIIKRDLFNEEILKDIKNESGTYDINIVNDNFCKYIIIPYYYDDNNKEIIGLPYKYGDDISILEEYLKSQY